MTFRMTVDTKNLDGDPRKALVDFLTRLRDFSAVLKPPGFEYANLFDFLLRHGRHYTPRELPPGTWRGGERMCFGNSIYLGDALGLQYVEGYAMTAFGFPVHHAWNVTPGGDVFDTTWKQVGLAYFGVEFSIGRADDASWNGDASVLDDFMRGHPLFHQEWKGEDYSRVWEPSPALQTFRERDHNRALRLIGEIRQLDHQKRERGAGDPALAIAEALRDQLRSGRGSIVEAHIADCDDEGIARIREYLSGEENARLKLRRVAS
jgi:hypothetical protein